MAHSASSTICALVSLALCLLFIPLQKVEANSIRVDHHCTLVQAIGSANNNSSKARCERGYRDDTIILKDDIELEELLPDITSKITLEGNNHTIYVPAKRPAFVIKWGELTIKNLTVKFINGNRSSPSIKIKNGTLTIIDSRMTRCTGKFQVENSLGVVQGDSSICGYSTDTVSSWFSAAPPLPTPTQLPSQPHTCDTLSGTAATVSATLGLHSGVQCQQVTAAGIGIQSVIDAGFIDAVDVWGYVEQGVEICFPRQGSIIFLDAATSPRSVSPTQSYRAGDKTCVELDRPGTVVLVPGQSATSETLASVENAAPQDCRLITTANLNFRAAPSMGDNVIGYVRRGATLSALSRTTNWFKVDLQGKVGWISASPRYVQTSGTCG